MRNMMKKAAQNVKAVAVRAGMLMKDTKGENYVDTAVKILIAVVQRHGRQAGRIPAQFT